MNISKIKKEYNLPLRKDEMEYWGPVTHQLSNAFLSMGQDFLDSYIKGSRVKKKKIFTAFIELVQNIADYNEKKTEHNLSAFVKLTVEKDQICIYTISEVFKEDEDRLKKDLEYIFNLNQLEIKKKYKEALIENKSLGLLMLRGMPDSIFNYSLRDDNLRSYINFNFRTNH